MTRGTAFVALGALALGAVVVAQPAGQPAPRPARDDAAAERLGWKLGVQAWTFRDRTAFEAVDAAKMLGLKYIEFYPGQALSPEHRDAEVGPKLTSEQRSALKAKLASCGVKAMNFGVYNFSADEADARAVFDFARDMGIETITCEPKDTKAWDVVEKLTREFHINAACHNHPKPTHYWDPDIVLDAIRDRGPRVGICADTGHWSRSGFKPAECLAKCQGHVLCLHFKDISAGEDRPWGTGDGDARAMLRELHRQGFSGVISLEYETGKGKELEDNAALCVAFFDDMARQIAAEAAERK